MVQEKECGVMQITRDMTIEEILSGFPQKSQKLAQEMTQMGLHCVGCQASTWETLEAGVLGHGFTEQDLEGLIGKLNKMLVKCGFLEGIPTLMKTVKEVLDSGALDAFGDDNSIASSDI